MWTRRSTIIIYYDDAMFASVSHLFQFVPSEKAYTAAPAAPSSTKINTPLLSAASNELVPSVTVLVL